MENLFNGEFEFEDDDQLFQFLKEASTEELIQILEMSLNHANSSGAFNMKESITAFHCLTNLKEKI